MATPSTNDLFKKQKDKLVRSTFKKAFINSVNALNATADVFFAESPQTIIRRVPLAANLIPSLIVKGDRCRVDVFDETNPDDMVVAYIYGRSFKLPLITIYNHGTGNVSNGGGNSFSVAHGLKDENNVGVVPDLYIVLASGFPFYSPTNTTYVFTISGADATNIYFDRIPNNTIAMNYIWFAVKFRP